MCAGCGNPLTDREMLLGDVCDPCGDEPSIMCGPSAGDDLVDPCYGDEEEA
jgi:hypothetical protein